MGTEAADQHTARLQRLSADITALGEARNTSDPEAAARLVHALTVQLRDAAAETMELAAAEFAAMTGYRPEDPEPGQHADSR